MKELGPRKGEKVTKSYADSKKHSFVPGNKSPVPNYHTVPGPAGLRSALPGCQKSSQAGRGQVNSQSQVLLLKSTALCVKAEQPTHWRRGLIVQTNTADSQRQTKPLTRSATTLLTQFSLVIFSGLKIILDFLIRTLIQWTKRRC